MYLGPVGAQQATEYIPVGNQCPSSPCTGVQSNRCKGIQENSSYRPPEAITGPATSRNPSSKSPPLALYDSKGNVHNEGEDTQGRPKSTGQTQSPNGVPVRLQEMLELSQLERRDQEVKAHERAHMAAGAGLVRGGVNYHYKRGPDGNLYAVGGEVTIDTSEGRTPQDTIRKMQRVRATALAPANPSAQDRRVAAKAAAKAVKARAELARQTAEAVTQGSLRGHSQGGDFGVGRNLTGIQAYHAYQNPRTSPTRAVGNFINTAI